MKRSPVRTVPFYVQHSGTHFHIANSQTGREDVVAWNEITMHFPPNVFFQPCGGDGPVMLYVRTSRNQHLVLVTLREHETVDARISATREKN